MKGSKDVLTFNKDTGRYVFVEPVINNFIMTIPHWTQNESFTIYS